MIRRIAMETDPSRLEVSINSMLASVPRTPPRTRVAAIPFRPRADRASRGLELMPDRLVGYQPGTSSSGAGTLPPPQIEGTEPYLRITKSDGGDFSVYVGATRESYVAQSIAGALDADEDHPAQAALPHPRLGFFGVIVLTWVHTPRRCGLPGTLNERKGRSGWPGFGTPIARNK